MASESGIEALIRFARHASEAGRREAILPLLADAMVAHVGADAVAILEIHDAGVKMVPSPHLPKEIESISVDPDAVGSELGNLLLAVCRPRFANAYVHPLVSGGGLFGSAVTFFVGDRRVDHLPLAEGLVDMASVMLEGVAKLHHLARSQTELRASQAALVRGERLRALGQMAAGVSHDLKNILNPLSLHLQLMERAADKGQAIDLKQTAVDMKQVLVRGAQTIDRLRDYGRQSREARPEPMDLDQLVREAAKIARPRMASRGHVARIVEDLGAPLPVMGRAGDVVSALVNLIVNAIDVLPEGGTITLRTGEDAGNCFVQVQDDGPGMPPEVEHRVFEPFFTTKGDEGTGLGLAMVYACMQRHGGSVNLETAPGKGTTFTLLFPRAASVPPPNTPPEPTRDA